MVAGAAVAVYEDRTIIQRTTIVNNHVSYNGGPGGINHQPAPEEQAAAHDQHTAPTSFQAQHENTFRNDHTAYAKVNGGHPQNAAISRPLAAENHPAPANNSLQNHGAPATEHLRGRWTGRRASTTPASPPTRAHSRTHAPWSGPRARTAGKGIRAPTRQLPVRLSIRPSGPLSVQLPVQRAGRLLRGKQSLKRKSARAKARVLQRFQGCCTRCHNTQVDATPRCTTLKPTSKWVYSKPGIRSKIPPPASLQ